MPFAIGRPDSVGRSAAIVAQCKDDYLVVGGLRLCSASFQTTAVDGHVHGADGTFHKNEFQVGQFLNASYNFPTLMTDVTPGPFMVRFVSSQANSARGFNLNFRQNPCK